MSCCCRAILEGPFLLLLPTIPSQERVGLGDGNDLRLCLANSQFALQGYLWVINDDGVETYDVRNPSAAARAGGLPVDQSQRSSQMLLCSGFGIIMTTDRFGHPGVFPAGD